VVHEGVRYERNTGSTHLPSVGHLHAVQGTPPQHPHLAHKARLRDTNDHHDTVTHGEYIRGLQAMLRRSRDRDLSVLKLGKIVLGILARVKMGRAAE